MLRPKFFGVNPETAESNALQAQSNDEVGVGLVAARAQEEFDGFVAQLRAAGVKVIVMEDSDDVRSPDAVFLNNWFSTHPGGRVVFYPMEAENRRRERRLDMIEHLREEGIEVVETIDYSEYELEGKFLESTGSMILDREHGSFYACISTRTDEDLARKFAAEMDFKPVLFHAEDEAGVPLYHTNVMMAIGEGYAVVCLEVIVDKIERQIVVDNLMGSGHEIVDISLDQVRRFAGNMLQLRGANDQKVLVMSASARAALEPEQVATLERHAELLVADVSVIERCGGGSVRCMLGEVFC